MTPVVMLLVSTAYAMLNQRLRLAGICVDTILLVRWFVWRSIDDRFRDESTVQTRESDYLNHTEP